MWSIIIAMRPLGSHTGITSVSSGNMYSPKEAIIPWRIMKLSLKIKNNLIFSTKFMAFYYYEHKYYKCAYQCHSLSICLKSTPCWMMRRFLLRKYILQYEVQHEYMVALRAHRMTTWMHQSMLSSPKLETRPLTTKGAYTRYCIIQL